MLVGVSGACVLSWLMVNLFPCGFVVGCFGWCGAFCVRLLLRGFWWVLFNGWLAICLVGVGLRICLLLRVLRGGVMLSCYSSCGRWCRLLFVVLVGSFLWLWCLLFCFVRVLLLFWFDFVFGVGWAFVFVGSV